MGLQKCLLFSFHFFSRFSMHPLSPCLFFLVVAFIFFPSQPFIFWQELTQSLCLQHLIFSFFLLILTILFSFAQALFSFKFLIFFLPLPFLKFWIHLLHWPYSMKMLRRLRHRDRLKLFLLIDFHELKMSLLKSFGKLKILYFAQ